MTLIALQPRQIAQHLAVAAFCSWPIFNFLANNFAENIISNAVLLAFAAVYALALFIEPDRAADIQATCREIYSSRWIS